MRKLYAILMAAFLAVPSLQAANAVVDSSATPNFAAVAEANDLLKQLRRDAREVQTAIARLEAFVRDTRLSWDSHATEWTRVKDRIEAMRKPLMRLEAIQHQLLPEQKEAFVRIASSAAVSAARTTSAINILNERKTAPLLLSSDYLRDVQAVYQRAQMIRDATRPVEVWAAQISEEVAS